MKKLINLVVVGSFVILVSGCATSSTEDMTKIVTAYYQQQRTYETVKLEGASEITIKGSNINFVIANQLPPVSIYPRDPSTLSTVVDGVARLGGILGAAYVGNGLVNAVAARPQVVETRPEIVRPEIITLPAQ
jgi:hypothetical protein